MNAQQKYALEMQARYYKYLQAEAESEKKLVARATENEKKTLRKRREREPKNYAQEANGENAGLAMDRYMPKGLTPVYRLHTLIIDSSHRDVNVYPNTNDFVVKIQDSFRNVAAVRILRSEFYSPTNNVGAFIVNQAQVPLQLYNLDHAYLYLNAYTNMMIANDGNLALFGRVGPGTEHYPAVSANIMDDPYAYVLSPMEPRLRRFHVKLLTHEGLAYPVNNARLVLTLAIYSVV